MQWPPLCVKINCREKAVDCNTGTRAQSGPGTASTGERLSYHDTGRCCSACTEDGIKFSKVWKCKYYTGNKSDLWLDQRTIQKPMKNRGGTVSFPVTCSWQRQYQVTESQPLHWSTQNSFSKILTEEENAMKTCSNAN